MLILTILMLPICLGSVYRPTISFLACGTCLGHFAWYAAIVTTGVLRYSSDGKACAGSDMLVAEGVKFSDHGDVIQKLFISQLAVVCCYYCCVYGYIFHACTLAY